MTSSDSLGVFGITNTLHDNLRSYLESVYHIHNLSLINERRQLFQQKGTISQAPYVESTSTYEVGRPYVELDIPEPAKRILTELAYLSPSVGVFPRPYLHQSEALEAFLGCDKDIIVATGTGSGKTESFLMPILGALEIERVERPNTAELYGCRALLIYPMNALVNDQLARIRRLFGDERVAKALSHKRGRPVRFGSYTSRTPYPGERCSSKDTNHIAPMFNDFYLTNDQEKITLLKEKGKWPSKDLVGFYAKEKEEAGTYKSGRRQGSSKIWHHWDMRLKTQPGDRELFTRHEMQFTCPDILITNYSMLEYMLMRPIERRIFNDTKLWLDSNPKNQLILVLDEAHMYRGTGGAEVAFLIRRLMARLGISRNKLRCILTSASLGEDLEAELAVKRFAKELTGMPLSSSNMHLIRGVRERRWGARAGTNAEGRALAEFDVGSFQNVAINFITAIKQVADLAGKLKWSFSPELIQSLPDYIFERLTGWGPSELMVQMCSGAAVLLPELATSIFPNLEESLAYRATEGLIALSTYAHRSSDGRVFLPTRLHLFYRGISGLFACTNPNCTERLDNNPPPQAPILGRLFTSPHLHCSCSTKARVFEILTHRDCGTAFLRAYVRGDNGKFLLYEPTNAIGFENDITENLFEIQLLVDGDPHPNALGSCLEVWLDISTGHLVDTEPKYIEGFIKVYIPAERSNSGDRVFGRCPICLRTWRGRSKIMDLTTKGEAPFANLVKAQLLLQPPRREESLDYPNGGRKVLLFSDGRQKAARLARDIPREVEWDSFRQVIALAAVRFHKLFGKNPKINATLYGIFVSVVSEYNLQLFDGSDRKELVRAIKNFREDYEGSLKVAIENDWHEHPPVAYYRALLRQLCSREFSLRAATLGYVMPANLSLLLRDVKSVTNKLSTKNIEELAVTFIEEMLESYAFETESVIAPSVRQEAAGHPQKSWVSEGKIPDIIRNLLHQSFGCTLDEILDIQEIMRRRLCIATGNAFVIKSDAVVLAIDTKCLWYRCKVCTYLSPVILGMNCVNCGSDQVETLDPASSDYIHSRKGFLRNPVVLAIEGTGRPKHVAVEEHTAQLSQRDAGMVFATTEKYELRFQDVIVNDNDDGPIDVLSCTTTMEVGIDIGDLVAVGLRNVPPQRENYQQRAGRAGRRGSSVSTVITYAQGGPHDSHYFHHPHEIVTGAPRLPMLKTDNSKIARRHVHAYLFQTFFHEMIDNDPNVGKNNNKSLFAVLGAVSDFFNNEVNTVLCLKDFERWVNERAIISSGDILNSIVNWLPEGITANRHTWVQQVASDLLCRLRSLSESITLPKIETNISEKEDSDSDSVDLRESHDELLSFLFDQGLLPSYAFPTNLCSFMIEETESRKGGFKVKVKERPQQSIEKALSEYAPGRLVVVDKLTYRSGGITSNSSRVTDPDRAVPLFQEKLWPYHTCNRCTFVQDMKTDPQELSACPICGGNLDRGELLIPEVFHPEKGQNVSESNQEQELTYATTAQFPIPLGEDDLQEWQFAGCKLRVMHAQDRRLVMVNKGDDKNNQGFEICTSCGASYVFNPDKPHHGSHPRPYKVEPSQGIIAPTLCNGSFRRVYIGYQFRTDLLILRMNIESPLVRLIELNTPNSVLNEALRTISESLILGASHKLDIDPSEFQAGFRLVRTGTNDPLRADLYLFDTLAGGAGYAEQAGQQIEEILRYTLDLLEECPGQCDRSCTDCLRHYQNRYWHMQLDRFLGAALLRYMLYEEAPVIKPMNGQAEDLKPLIRLLELDGYTCQTGVLDDGIIVPLIVTNANKRVLIGTFPALLDEEDGYRLHPLVTNRTADPSKTYHLVNDYLLTRNLSLVYSKVKSIVDC